MFDIAKNYNYNCKCKDQKAELVRIMSLDCVSKIAMTINRFSEMRKKETNINEFQIRKCIQENEGGLKFLIVKPAFF